MTDSKLRSEQPISANKRRGLGRPFVKGDQRINRAGVPKESLEFQRHLREALAQELQRPSASKGELTRFDRIVQRIVELAELGVHWAVEMIFDRLGGKPAQAPADGTPVEIQVNERNQIENAADGQGSGGAA